MMTRLLFCAALFIGATPSGLAQAGYHVQIDVTALENDQLPVSITVPPIDQDTAVFVFPVTVPGTYEPHLWWRLVHNFQAFDGNGSPLPVSRSVDSQFVINNATALARVQYRIADSFDDEDERVSIFQPTGTSFQGDSVFVFNHGGMIGYVEGYQRIPYKVTVDRPEDLYCSTAQHMSSRGKTKDTYDAPTYDALVDGPAIFARPDTTSFVVNGVDVQVALIHGRSTKVADNYAKTLESVTAAIGAYLPSMPVDRYAFLLYLWDGDTVEVKRAGSAQGALEHSYSSLYFWRYTSKPFGLESVAAHEFLHILIPLNLHSREIDEFNFRDPKMSAHLWLYEGVTEYFANQALLRGKIVSESRFIGGIKQQGRSLNRLPSDFSLCEFSKNVLEDDNQRLYPLIYQVGPLNALLMDIMLREQSNGTSGLLELVYELMETHGPSKPFDDDTLFAEIEARTFPEFGAYCRKHIAGSEPMPLQELLGKIGMTYLDSTSIEALSFGVGFADRPGGTEQIILEPEGQNPLGVSHGDVLLSVDGSDVASHGNQSIRRIFNPRKDQSITLRVLRDGTEVELQGLPVTQPRTVRHIIGEADEPTDEQLTLRRQVFFGQ